MRAPWRDTTTKAFALPTVLIASVVLLSILAVSVTATAAVRTTLKNQYYAQLAQVAGESGVAFAKTCLAQNGNIPLWSDAKPLTPATDCSGNVVITPSVQTLIVAGGGAGGGSTGGGGGAGGVISKDSVAISQTSYPVVVGAGGATTPQQTTGNNGANSSFNGLVAIGGGGGGASAPSVAGSGGQNGGSGGGGQSYYSAQPPGSGTSDQGNNGGAGINANTGGGGGAGGPGGSNPTLNVGGPGGPGVQYGISGSMVYYAAGGGGGNGGTGGSGIGGNGAQTAGAAGAANTGSGGGGGWNHVGGSGGAGGSGVVIISFPVASGITATGGTVTTVGGNEIHKFTSSGTFAVTSVGNATCPSDSRCYVEVDGNVRSSFSVPKPTVDADGRAVTIPNTGYVEVTRTSSGVVWRTFKQPSVQAAVVPDLCSGNATAARGWSAVVKTTQQDVMPSAASAQTISLANAPLNAGIVYYRKDFNIGVAGTYTLDVYTSSAQDVATTYVDGTLTSTSAGSLASNAVTLSTGCHVIVTKVINQTYLPRASHFTASLTQPGLAAPAVVSDSSWRATAGDPTSFATPNYYEAATAWAPAYVFGIWNNTALPWGSSISNWSSASGDSLAQWISTQYNTGGTNRPGNAYAWFRQTQPFTTSVTTDVRVTNACDDLCDLYLDGNLILSTPPSVGAVSKTITIQPGTHTFGVQLYNNPSGNVGAFLFAALDLSTNKVLARSGVDWDSTTSWSSSPTNLYSYDASYLPTPAVESSATARVLVVGGGGGGGSDMGGGGGGGGVVYDATHQIYQGSYSVVVGAGGAGGPAGQSQVRGSNGGDSTFDTIRAYGGGGGGSEYASNVSPPGAGGSAGGSAGCGQNLYGGYVIGQGNGSAGTPGCYYPTGGGGAGGPGATNPATGGVGVSNSILGTAYYWGGGGGGAGYSSIGGNGGNGGGGGGGIGTTYGGSGLNPGSPGGGGATVTQANTPGGNGGANTGGGGGGGSHYNANNYGGTGGSGIVVISYPTGSMVATGGAITTSGGNTIHTFYSSGNFIVNGPPTVDALLVAGGGGGGGNCSSCGGAGGGGAGGLVYATGIPVTVGSMPVVVGAGGAGGAGVNTASGQGGNGGNSAFSTYTAIGGGSGHPQDGTAGSNGGSGGGGSGGGSPVPGSGGSGLYGQGNAGTGGGGSPSYAGGGGGGAGAPAGGSSAGGSGVFYSISGINVAYAGGGAGGAYQGNTPGVGGIGGGGNGANSSINGGKGYPGTANTGGGGGGANGSTIGGTGGNGGSGVVIISYDTGSITATGGTITTVGGRTIHTFVANGTFTITAIND